jgi:hypothetical protein
MTMYGKEALNMNRFPLALRRYVIAAIVVGGLAWAASGLVYQDKRSVSLSFIAALLVLLVLAQSLPKHTLLGAKVTLNSVPLFLAVLVLPVGTAVTTVVIGMTAAEVLNRRPWCEVVFNSACAAMETALGGLVYAGLAHEGGFWSAVWAAGVSGVVIYLINVSLVAGVVTAQHSLVYSRVWRGMALMGIHEHVLMFLVGGLVAVIVVRNLAVAELLLVAAFVLYVWAYRKHRLFLPRLDQTLH